MIAHLPNAPFNTLSNNINNRTMDGVAECQYPAGQTSPVITVDVGGALGGGRGPKALPITIT